MAAIDFPASPSPGDKHPTSGSISGKVWMWDGTTWKIVSTNGTVNLTVDDVTTWTLGASGSSHYTFTGDGFVSATNDPTLYLIRGQTYKFDNQTGGHPFRIQSTVAASGGGTAYNTGVTNNDATGGTATNVLTFVVPMDAPDTLYYQCTAHPVMTGTIYVITQGSSTNITYDLTAENGSVPTEEKIQLAGSDNSEDSVILAVDASSGLTIARSNNTITFANTVTDTDTTYNVVDATADGLAPQLPAAHGGKFLKADGTWEVPAYVTYSTFTTTAAGLAPLTPGGTDKFLRADGQWQIPSGSGGGSGYGIAQLVFESGPSNQISANANDATTWIDVIDKDIVLTSNNQVQIEVNGEPRLNGFRTMRYEIRLIRTTGGTETTLYEGHQGLSDSSDNYSTMNGVNWVESPGTGTHNYKYQFRQVISWNNSAAYVAVDSMTMTLTEIAPGSSGGGSSDGNDYITSAQLGTGANAKVLTLGFVNASLNQTVDLASINTDTDTTYSLVNTTDHGLAPVLPATHGGKFLKADGTWEVPPDTDTNTTYNVVSVGGDGLAPQLPASSSGKYLKDDGTWDTPPDTDTNTTYQNFNTSNAGLTPISPGGTTKYLRADGTWEVPPDTDTNTTYGQFSTSTDGLVPQSPGGTAKYLRADGTWQEVSGGGSSDGNDYVTGVGLGTGADAKKLTLSFSDTSLNQTVDLASIDTDTNTTYNVVSVGGDGLAPQLPASGGSTKYLRADGTWDTPTDTNTTYGQFSTSQAGLVPQSPGGTAKYLRADGSWQEVTSGGGDGNDYVTNLSLSGTTLKAEFATSSLDQTVDLASINTDTNTTYNVVSTSADGLAPQLPSSHGGKYLRADGSWQVPPDTDTDTNTNWYADTFDFNSSNNVLTIEYSGNSSLNTTVTINPSSAGSASIPTGSAMLFAQGSAPTGWTKSTSHNNKALRVVSGSGGGSGGSVGFTSAFQNHTVSISDTDTVSVGGSVTISGNCTGTQVMYVTTTQAWLTTDQIPSHAHQYHNPIGTSGGQHGFVDTQNSGSSGQPTTNSTGGSNYHTHAVIMYYINGSNFEFSGTDGWSDSDTVSISGSDDVNCAVQYVDVIICTKD